MHVTGVLSVDVSFRQVIGHDDYPTRSAARFSDAQLFRVRPHELGERTYRYIIIYHTTYSEISPN